MSNTSKQYKEFTINHEIPAPDEFIKMRTDTGLTPVTMEAAQNGLPNSIFAVTIRKGEQLIGMGRLIGDGGCVYQICDIAVDEAYQGQGLGKIIMNEVMEYVREEVPLSAYVSLIADFPADKLYAQYGFHDVGPRSMGMGQRLK